MSNADDIRAWIEKAEEDWLCVRNEMAAAQTPWAVVSFHERKVFVSSLEQEDTVPS